MFIADGSCEREQWRKSSPQPLITAQEALEKKREMSRRIGKDGIIPVDGADGCQGDLECVCESFPTLALDIARARHHRNTSTTL